MREKILKMVAASLAALLVGTGCRRDMFNQPYEKPLERSEFFQDNHMASRVYSLCTELSLYGEQFIRFFVNPYDGHVKIAQIDPSMIDQIETDPENIERVVRVHRRATAYQAGLPN